MNLTYLDHMGSDLAVVNAARVSFDKESEWADAGAFKDILKDSDKKLISYLAKHNHWSPFAHCTVKFRFKAPIFVARQLAKHQVGFSWNEVSRRYVDSPPELYWPAKWRKKADNVKQGSSEEEFINHNITWAKYFVDGCVTTYNIMLDKGCCPEQARMILPQNMYTEWIWTGSLYGWSRVYSLRTEEHAQKEVQDLIKQLDPIMEKLFPVSWSALTRS